MSVLWDSGYEIIIVSKASKVSKEGIVSKSKKI